MIRGSIARAFPLGYLARVPDLGRRRRDGPADAHPEKGIVPLRAALRSSGRAKSSWTRWFGMRSTLRTSTTTRPPTSEPSAATRRTTISSSSARRSGAPRARTSGRPSRSVPARRRPSARRRGSSCPAQRQRRRRSPRRRQVRDGRDDRRAHGRGGAFERPAAAVQRLERPGHRHLLRHYPDDRRQGRRRRPRRTARKRASPTGRKARYLPKSASSRWSIQACRRPTPSA